MPAPIRSMIPRRAVKPLEHNLARWIGGIEKHVSEQRVAGIDRQSSRGAGEVMVVNPGDKSGLMSQRAGERCRIVADPIPRIASVRTGPRPCRHGTFHP